MLSIHLQLIHFPSVSAGNIDMLIYFPLPLQFCLRAIHLFIVFWWPDKAIHHPLVIFWSQILINEPCDLKRSSYDILCDLRNDFMKLERCTHTAIYFQAMYVHARSDSTCKCNKASKFINAVKEILSLRHFGI